MAVIHNSYGLFVQAMRREFEQAHPNETPSSFTEFLEGCADKWNKMSEEEKEVYKKEANTLKQLHQQKSKTEVEAKKPKISKEKKERMYLQASPFYWFCQDQRGVVIAEHPHFTPLQVARELGKRWIDASRDIKRKYEDVAEENNLAAESMKENDSEKDS